MEFKAKLKNLHISARKVRFLIDAMKKYKRLSQAVQALAIAPKRAARPLQKLLLSAGANAKQAARVPLEGLVIKSLTVTEGSRRGIKRYRPRERGKTSPYWKHMSHVEVILESDKKFTPVVRQQSDTKNEPLVKEPKPKQTFGTKMSSAKSSFPRQMVDEKSAIREQSKRIADKGWSEAIPRQIKPQQPLVKKGILTRKIIP